MVRPDFAKWGETAEYLRELSIKAEHPRSRERYQALYMIGSEQVNATAWARQINRRKQTVLNWVHSYNERGSVGVAYQHSGGRQPKLNPEQKACLIMVVKEQEPWQVGLPGAGWTLKKLGQWVRDEVGVQVSRTTIGGILRSAKLSWKKSKKLLGKADPVERAIYMPQFQSYFEQVCQGTTRLIFVDECHLHQDLSLGYRWSIKGQPDWVPSYCPSRKNRLNWYGAYDFSNGQCLIWENGACNSDNTVAFLEHLAQKWSLDPSQQPLIIWDGAPWHERSSIVCQKADELGLPLVTQPKYSPDLNPIEGLWKWMREELTNHHCYKYLYQLRKACFDFIDQINLDPEAIITRLWPKFQLDPQHENVLFSF